MAAANPNPLYAPHHKQEAPSREYRQSGYTVRQYSTMQHVERLTVDTFCEFMTRWNKKNPLPGSEPTGG